MNIFKHHLAFQPIDPLGDGLREEIEAERADPEAIRLEEDLREETIAQSWSNIVQDVEQDPEWFTFADVDD